MKKVVDLIARWVLTWVVMALFLGSTGYGFSGGAFSHWDAYVVLVALGMLAAWS